MIQAALPSKRRPGPYHVLQSLPTPGRVQLHPFRTLLAREETIGKHLVITTALYLQRDQPRAWPQTV